MRRVERLLLVAMATLAMTLFGTWTISGCDSGGDGDGDADSDGDSDADSDSDADGDPGCSGDNADDGERAAYIVDSLEIAGEEIGFDLDSTVTPDDCADDFCRRGPDDGPGGVDNRLGPILGSIGDFAPDFDANQAIEDSIIEGSLLVLFEMTDVDDWTNDGCVGVLAYMGEDPEDPPAVGRGRTYMVDPQSLTDPTDIESSLISFQGGNIEGGEYNGGPSEFSLNIPMGDLGVDLAINITDTRLQWDASTADVSGGIIGGFVLVHDMLAAIRLIPEAADFIPMVPAIMENQADIDAIPAGTEIPGTSCTADNYASYNLDGEGCGSPRYSCSDSGRCVEPEEHYDGISLALTFTAVDAIIDGIAP